MPPRKNVLFIIADQFRADCIGAAGNSFIRTPHLDALAREGVLFENAFVQTAPCGPSRMCIFTSRYACSTRAVENMTPLIDAEDNLALALRRAGFHPALVGYNDYAVDPRILPASDPRTTSLSYDNVLPGFDWVLNHTYDSSEYFDWLRKKGYPEELLHHPEIHNPNVPPEGPGDHLPLHYPAYYKADDSECRFLTEVATNWISSQKQNGWMLSLNYIKPHPPRICSAPYHAMYDPASVPVANRREEELRDSHPYFQLMHSHPKLVSDRDLRETRACYYGMVTEVDDCLGILFAALKASGRWEDTLIVVSSDHGEYLGDHYLLDKAHFYDETMRVPLIIRDPSPAANPTRGKKFDGFIESIDIAPTIMEYLGAEIPDRFQGRSVLDVIHGKPGAHLKPAIHHEDDFRSMAGKDLDPDLSVQWVVRDHHFKYVQFGQPSMPPLLFDLQRDPGEQHNLASKAEYAATVADYCQKLLRWRMKHEDHRMERWASKYR